jgi:hypothetical protein
LSIKVDSTGAAAAIASNSLSTPLKKLASKSYAHATSGGVCVRVIGRKRLVDAVRFNIRVD